MKKSGRKMLKSRRGASEKVSGANESDIVKIVKTNQTDIKESSDFQVQQAPMEMSDEQIVLEVNPFKAKWVQSLIKFPSLTIFQPTRKTRL